jgi:hypothetical protein
MTSNDSLSRGKNPSRKVGGRRRRAASGAFITVMAVAASLLAFASTAPAAVTTQTFTVSASSSSWLGTGIVLPSGASVTVSASGDGTCHAGGASDCPVGNPNGAGFTCANSPFGNFSSGPAGPDFPYGALAGRVGDTGVPFLVGTGRTVTGPGQLFFVFNDCNPPLGYSDNAGGYTITVTGDWSGSSPPAHYRFGFRVFQANTGLSAGSHGSFTAAGQPDSSGSLRVSAVSAKSFALKWHDRGRMFLLSLRFSGNGHYDIHSHSLTLGLKVVRTNATACRTHASGSSALVLSGTEADIVACGKAIAFTVPSNASDWVRPA